MFMIRHCACGRKIRLRDSICGDCRVKYGNDPNKWPEWFSFLVKNEQAEANRNRRHDFDLSIYDEYYSNNCGKSAVPQTEMDNEVLLWSNQ